MHRAQMPHPNYATATKKKLNIQKMMNKKKIFRPCGNCTACQRKKFKICKFCQQPNKKKDVFKENAKIKMTEKNLKTQ